MVLADAAERKVNIFLTVYFSASQLSPACVVTVMYNGVKAQQRVCYGDFNNVFYASLRPPIVLFSLEVSLR